MTHDPESMIGGYRTQLLEGLHIFSEAVSLTVLQVSMPQVLSAEGVCLEI